MNIESFCNQYGGDVRPAEEVVRSWRTAQIDHLLENAIAAGVLLGYAALGDGLQDQIPKELLDGFAALMGDKADQYQEIRDILLQKLESGDQSVLGLISKIKGQVGELRFAEEVGSTTRLASSGSQEAWDVAITKSSGTQYVQVKMYEEPRAVLAEMRQVQEKVQVGAIFDNGQLVDHVDFAVPANIADEVRQMATEEPSLSGIEILPIGISADEAANVVRTGFDNVGPEALEHFFGELVGSTAIAGSLHGAVNAFLLYKNAKAVDQALSDTAVATGITTIGIGAGLSTEVLLSEFSALAGPAGFVVGVSSRVFLSMIARSRWHFAEYLEASNGRTDELVAAMNHGVG